MSGLSNLRGSRTGMAHEGLPISDGVSSSSSLPTKKKWSKLLPVFVAFVVLAEIAFLGRIDMSGSAAIVGTLTDFLNHSPSRSLDHVKLARNDSRAETVSDGGRSWDVSGCEKWLEREDNVAYSRDFDQTPVLISGDDKEWPSCAVGCKFASNPLTKLDARFGLRGETDVPSVHRSMESSHYFAENNIDNARRRGHSIVMTTSLSSDVPVGYFSWAEYDIMAPLQPKTEKSLAAAFISNCAARNFRLKALEALEKANIKIDSYGACHRNHDGRVDKLETLKRYKFSLAFENSNEEDYVTEKYFQSLVAGTIPVVVGAPNIEEFSPQPGSVLHIKRLEDVDSVQKRMKYIAENPDAFNQSLRWKYDGPSDSFKALVDMAAVHSSCRLCIHVATRIQEQEEKNIRFKSRPCKCTRGSEMMHHLYVRERGRFEMESIFLRNLTMEALQSAVLLKFKSLQHVPVWKLERPKSIRGGDELKIYRIYPVGLTQRQALYNFKFDKDDDLRKHIESNPCAKFEVIFV